MKPMPKITTTISDDDKVWLETQATAIGLDEVGTTLRMLVRWARNNGVELAVTGRGAPGVPPVQEAHFAHITVPSEYRQIASLTETQSDGDPIDVDSLVNTALDHAEATGLTSAPNSSDLPPEPPVRALGQRRLGNLVAVG